MSARPGLCGGRRATGVPTAINNLSGQKSRSVHLCFSDSKDVLLCCIPFFYTQPIVLIAGHGV